MGKSTEKIDFDVIIVFASLENVLSSSNFEKNNLEIALLSGFVHIRELKTF